MAIHTEKDYEPAFTLLDKTYELWAKHQPDNPAVFCLDYIKIKEIVREDVEKMLDDYNFPPDCLKQLLCDVLVSVSPMYKKCMIECAQEMQRRN